MALACLRISFHDTFCRRQFFDFAAFPPAAPSLLSCPLLTPFVAPGCGEFGVSAGDAPLVGGTVSREYWLRPSLPRAFCGGRPPRRGAGGGLGSAAGASGGVGSEGSVCMAGSSLGVGVGVGSRGSLSVRCQLAFCIHVWCSYRRPSVALHVLCACLLLRCAPCLGPSRVAPSDTDFVLRLREVSAWGRTLLYCRLPTLGPVSC